MNRLSLKLFCVLTIGFICSLNFSCKDNKQKKTIQPVVITFKKEGELQIKKSGSDSLVSALDIEIADDDYSIQTGLMYRKSMEDSQGMLFLFPNSDYRSFYMKNTEIPLDIIYISENKRIVSIQKNAIPFDETSLPSEAPAKYVLEINGGLSDIWNLEKGDQIQFTTD